MLKEAAKTGKKEATNGVPARRAGYTLPIHQLRNEMDQLFDRFFGRAPMRAWPRGLFDWDWEPFRDLRPLVPEMRMPNVDVHETDREFTIEAELAGLDEKDVELELKDDVLTLKGEKKAEKEEKKKDYHLSERSWGSFERSFHLPDGVDRDKVSAKFRNGVLTVSLPKTEKARKESRKISIRS